MRPVFGEPYQALVPQRSEEIVPERLQKRVKNPEKFPMTALELRAATLLGSCRFGIGTWDKYFSRDMAAQARENPVITERQRFHLWRLVIRYRKQLQNELLVTAQEQIQAMQTPHGVERTT